MPIRRLAILMLLLLGLTDTEIARSAEPPAVVVSIKPLHALASGVMAGIGTPALIVSGAASPHDYALKPSDAASIESARLVFWMGPALEGFLVRPLGAAAPATSVPLGERLGQAILPLRTELPGEDHGAAPDGHADRHEHDEATEPTLDGPGHHHDVHDDDGAPLPDLHAWLDPTIAAAMVDTIVLELATVDPGNAPRYQENATTLKRDLAALDAELSGALASIKNRPFIVFHDAYQYLERRYGLRSVGALSLHPETPPGAKRLTALRERVEAGGAVCVFAEPQFEPKLVSSLIEGTTVRAATLDPLGADLPEAASSYAALMRGLAASLNACLGD